MFAKVHSANARFAGGPTLGGKMAKPKSGAELRRDRLEETSSRKMICGQVKRKRAGFLLCGLCL
jgi:hypothetical protein